MKSSRLVGHFLRHSLTSRRKWVVGAATALVLAGHMGVGRAADVALDATPSQDANQAHSSPPPTGPSLDDDSAEDAQETDVPIDVETAPLATPDADTAPQVGDKNSLPRPAALVPQIDFWKRVYTEIDSHQGFIHDARHLDIVYETVTVPAANRRHTSRYKRAAERRVSAILQTLATGKRRELTHDEARILALWPADVSNATLRDAAGDVRFQTGQKDRFLAGLVRSRTWMPYIERTIAAYHLPRELIALPHVESSFDMRAYSFAKAAGIWQFTPATARSYMQVTNVVDQRFDPIMATEAAAKLLGSFYKRTGEWPLAITSYNHGVEGVHRAMDQLHTNDLMDLIAKYHKHRFGFASRNFYAELLAAWDVSQHAEAYFGQLPTTEPPTYEALVTDAYYKAPTMARALGVSLQELRDYNPALRTPIWNGSRLIPKGLALRIPQKAGHKVGETNYQQVLAMIPVNDRFERDTFVTTPRRHVPRTAVARRHVVNHTVVAGGIPAALGQSNVTSSVWYPNVATPANASSVLAPWALVPGPLKN